MPSAQKDKDKLVIDYSPGKGSEWSHLVWKAVTAADGENAKRSLSGNVAYFFLTPVSIARAVKAVGASAELFGYSGVAPKPLEEGAYDLMVRIMKRNHLVSLPFFGSSDCHFSSAEPLPSMGVIFRAPLSAVSPNPAFYGRGFSEPAEAELFDRNALTKEVLVGGRYIEVAAVWQTQAMDTNGNVTPTADKGGLERLLRFAEENGAPIIRLRRFERPQQSPLGLLYEAGRMVITYSDPDARYYAIIREGRLPSFHKYDSKNAYCALTPSEVEALKKELVSALENDPETLVSVINRFNGAVEEWVAFQNAQKALRRPSKWPGPRRRRR